MFLLSPFSFPSVIIFSSSLSLSLVSSPEYDLATVAMYYSNAAQVEFRSACLHAPISVIVDVKVIYT